MRVVPALDELEDGHLGLGLDAEAAPIEELAFERREEALAQATQALGDRVGAARYVEKYVARGVT
jgi:hypothetical protein